MQEYEQFKSIIKGFVKITRRHCFRKGIAGRELQVTMLETPRYNVCIAYGRIAFRGKGKINGTSIGLMKNGRIRQCIKVVTSQLPAAWYLGRT